MMKKLLKIALTGLACSLMAISCSTTRVLQEGQKRLQSNELIVVNPSPDFNVNSVSAYVRQTPNSSFFGLNPFLSIYNWSDGKDKGIKGLFKKIGEPPVIFEESAVSISERSIEGRLEYLGWFNSNVESEIIENSDKLVSVRYYITLGQRYRISDISFELPEGTDFAADFLADSLSVSIKTGDYLSEDALLSEVNRSISKLKNKGYYSLERGDYAFEADTLRSDGTTSLKYKVSENGGPLCKVSIGKVSVNYPENIKFKESVLKGMNLIKPGDIYNEDVISNTYSRFSSLKVFNRVTVDRKQVADDLLDCDITLAKSKLQGFKADFEVSLNSSGLIGVSPKLSVYHKNLFGGGEWLNIGFNGNFQFRFNDNVHSNEVGTSINLSFPKFLGLSYDFFKGPSVPRTEFNLAFNYQSRPEYTRNMLSTSFGYSGNFSKKFYYQLYPMQLSYVRLFDLNEDFAQKLDRNPFMKYTYQSHCDLGLGANLSYSTSSDVIPKDSYWTYRLSGDISGNIISLFNSLMESNEAGEKLIMGAPYSQYARVQLSVARGLRFGNDDKQSIAFRLLGGIGVAYCNSSVLPYEKQFYCGGASSMRGWQARALGPGYSQMYKGFSIPSQTGDVKLEANLEYRFPMFWKLEGALFAEAGNVWNRADGVDLGALAADWGFGLRLNLDFILVRMDMGIRLRDPSLEDNKWLDPVSALRSRGFGIHFGVGYPF